MTKRRHCRNCINFDADNRDKCHKSYNTYVSMDRYSYAGDCIEHISNRAHIGNRIHTGNRIYTGNRIL